MGYTENELKALLMSDLGLSGSPSDYPLYDLERMAFFSGFSTPKGLSNIFTRPVGNTIVLFGNSRVAHDSADTATIKRFTNYGFFTWANARMGGRFQVLNNAGLAGDLLTGMIARFDADVANYSPNWVLLADPVNDATNGFSSAQMIENTKVLINKIKSIGARTILCTAPPSNGHNASQRQALNDFNTWVKLLYDPFVVVVDLATVVTDPTTGGYSATYSDDGLHQNPYGAARLGRQLANVVTPLLPVRDPFASGPTDNTEAVSNPWATGTPGAAPPTSWTTAGGTAANFSTVARTDLIPSNWMVMDTSAAGVDTDVYFRQMNQPNPFNAGDKVQLAVEVQAESWTSVTRLELFAYFIANDGSTILYTLGAINRVVNNYPKGSDQPLAPDVWIWKSPIGVVPAGVTKIQIVNNFYGQGITRIGRVSLRKVA